MPQYKHLTPEFIEATALDVDRMLEEQRQQEFEEARLARIRDYMANPANAAAIAQDPMVKAIRALPERSQTSTPAGAPVQRTAPTTVAPSGYKSRQQLEAERPWLRSQKPSTKLIDPYAR